MAEKLQKFLRSRLTRLTVFSLLFFLVDLSEANAKRIVILAGAKSHEAKKHEYIKSARLIKAMLEQSTARQITVDIFNDWPEDVTIFDKADAIMTISDGRDGHLFTEASYLLPERVPVIEKQMKRGCGFITFHFSTFAPDVYGEKVLEWGGGYFDWQDDKGDRNWYSNIIEQETDVVLASPTHSISNGVKPFHIREEFYYNLRFIENDKRFSPIVEVPTLNEVHKNGKVVAWAVSREDGGRGFCTSMGHFYENWKNDNFRKLILNGIAWAAGYTIPPSGISSSFLSDREVTQWIFKKSRKALILTGDNIVAHEWQNTSATIKKIMEDKLPFHTDISVNIEDLYQYDLSDYDLLILNYCNWNHPKPLSDDAKQSFIDYLKNGGGLIILHFSNGAFHSSLPNAPNTDWPEFREICKRVWDHHSNSMHDDFGQFKVNITTSPHYITRGLKDFVTTDELYYNQKGNDSITPLITARSKNTGKDEPLAWAFDYGKGRVFQTLLGHNTVSYESKGFQELLKRAARWSAKIENTDWAHAGGNPGQTKYSPLEQINKKNVSGLTKAWTYHSGNAGGNIQCNPLVINGVMYVTTASQHLVAVNAANGKEIWRFNPARKSENFSSINRGIAFWSSENGSRIFYTSGQYLNAVDAVTGKAISSFGKGGRINMSEGLERPAGQMNILSPAAPVLFKNLVILGAMTWSADANVSAFNVITGKREWLFHTIPHKGEYGYNTWGDTNFYRKGAGVNVWGGLCIDNKNEIIYFSTGQPKADFYRPNNYGKQLYGNSIVALKAGTGKRLWHYQTIHNDLWDLDLPCAPVLVTLQVNNKNIPGVMQLSKTGNIFLFNRLTGELLSKVEERKVPSSSLKSQRSWPSQPFVIWPEPFSKQVVTENDLTDLTPEAYRNAKIVFDKSEKGMFVPPSEKGVLYYGIHGGAEWGGGAYDETQNTLFVNANEIAWLITMKNRDVVKDKIHPGRKVFMDMNCYSCHGANREGAGNAPALNKLNLKYKSTDLESIVKNGRGAMPAFSQITKNEMNALTSYLLNDNSKQKLSNSAYYESQGYNKFLDANGYPATKPPWGTLNAVDLTTGKIKWKVPLGEYKELSEKSIPLTGTENFGGSIVTKGGLVFIAATRDEKLRAFDKDTGEKLWETQLPFGGYAIPATCAVDGKQYVIIPATGGGKLGTPTGDTYVAYSLP